MRSNGSTGQRSWRLAPGRARSAPSPAPSSRRVRDAEAHFATGLTPPARGPRSTWRSRSSRRRSSRTPRTPTSTRGSAQAYAQPSASGATRSRPSARRSSSTPTTWTCATTSARRSSSSGKREEGKKEFLAAFNDPTNPTPEISARNLGQAYLEEKNYAEAINWFRTSLDRNKGYADAYLGLADALLAIGPPRRGDRRARGRGARSCPRTRRSCSPSARPISRRAASRRRGRGSRRRPARIRRARPAGGPSERAQGLSRRIARASGRSRSLPYQRHARRPARAPVAAPRPRCCSTRRARSWSRRATRDVRHRLIGAYQGIALATAKRTAARFASGAHRSHASAVTPAGRVILRPLKDGYYLVRVAWRRKRAWPRRSGTRPRPRRTLDLAL